MDYPPPSIPLSPVLSGHGIQLRGHTQRTSDGNSILASPNLVHVTSGRAAIALALEHSRITEGDEVLVPAYHCESMVSPVHWRGSEAVFYKVNSDATVDINDIQNKVSTNTKAVIVTHYFGFLQDMQPLVELCEKRGLVLIEDCAHAFFGSRDGKRAGTWGDYAIASSMKFFPVYDGGILASNRKTIGAIELRSPSLFFQIKSPLNVVQAAIAYKRLGLAGKALKYITAAVEGVWAFVKRVNGREHSGIHGPSSSGGGYGLDEAWIHCRASWFSQFVIKHQCKDSVASLRRKNYLTLHKALGRLPHSRPLFKKLPEGIVPLVFPLYVEEPSMHFERLKRCGVPIWRFGEFLDEKVTEALCANSVNLSAHVFQFPCHQELTDKEIDWMINQITDSFHAQPSRV